MALSAGADDDILGPPPSGSIGSRPILHLAERPAAAHTTKELLQFALVVVRCLEQLQPLEKTAVMTAANSMIQFELTQFLRAEQGLQRSLVRDE